MSNTSTQRIDGSASVLNVAYDLPGQAIPDLRRSELKAGILPRSLAPRLSGREAAIVHNSILSGAGVSPAALYGERRGAGIRVADNSQQVRFGLEVQFGQPLPPGFKEALLKNAPDNRREDYARTLDNFEQGRETNDHDLAHLAVIAASIAVDHPGEPYAKWAAGLGNSAFISDWLGYNNTAFKIGEDPFARSDFNSGIYRDWARSTINRLTPEEAGLLARAFVSDGSDHSRLSLATILDAIGHNREISAGFVRPGKPPASETNSFKLTAQENAFVREAFIAGGTPKDPTFVSNYTKNDHAASDIMALALTRSIRDGKPDEAEYKRLSGLLRKLESEGVGALKGGELPPYFSEKARKALIDELTAKPGAPVPDFLKSPNRYI